MSDIDLSMHELVPQVKSRDLSNTISEENPAEYYRRDYLCGSDSSNREHLPHLTGWACSEYAKILFPAGSCDSS